MSRTTAAAVKETLNRDYDSIDEPSLDTYIDTAAALVSQMVQCATRKGVTIDDELQELIMRWLAAHAYALSDRTYKGRSTLRASGQFDSQTGMHLEATTYGQMAVNLDPSGCLESIGKRTRVRAFWLGRRPSEQTDVVDRS